MNTNIEITNINKHFFLNSENNESEENNKKYKTKLVDYCFFSINEVNISYKIKKILYYSNNYSIIEDYDFININQLNDEIIEKLNLTDEKKQIYKERYKNKYDTTSEEYKQKKREQALKNYYNRIMEATITKLL